MTNLSHLTINQLKNLKSIFISVADWDEVSNIQYEIDTRKEELHIKTWMFAFLVHEYLKHKKNLIDDFISELENKQ